MDGLTPVRKAVFILCRRSRIVRGGHVSDRIRIPWLTIRTVKSAHANPAFTLVRDFIAKLGFLGGGKKLGSWEKFFFPSLVGKVIFSNAPLMGVGAIPRFFVLEDRV